MDLTTILGLGLIAYYFTQKINAVKEDVKKNYEDDVTREDDLLNKIDAKNPKNIAEKYLQITPYFWTRETGGTKWSASFFWKIKNTSPDTTLTIVAIKSSFWMDNGVHAYYVPMKENISVVVRPGAEVKIQMSDDVAPWFETKSDCKSVRNDILSKCEGSKENYKSLMTADVSIKVKGDHYATPVIANFANVRGYVWRDTSAARYFQGQYGGKNGIDTVWQQ